MTFNPDKTVFELAKIIEDQVDFIIIIDNNSSQDIQSDLSGFVNGKRICLIQNDDNLGIARALNQGIEKAKQLNYEWVLTFDQDTIANNNIVDLISEVFNSYPKKEEIGFIGVNFPIPGNRSYYTSSSQLKYSIKDYLITSGTLLSLDAYFESGPFRDDFFIDNVDLEYSLRLRKNKKALLITKEWGMIHKAGNPIVRKILGIKLESSNHNAFRRYYMARNHILLSKEYFISFPYFIVKLNFFFLLSLIKFLIVEEDKRSKFVASLKGIKDGLFFK